MKKIKKLVAVMLAAIMVMAMGSVGVLASNTYDITITNANGNTGHTYIAYQIFAGDYSSGVLSNIKWGDNFDTSKVSALVTALKGETAFSNAFKDLDANSTTLAADIADILSGKDDDGEFARAFAAIIGGYITGNGVSSSDNGSGTYTITVDKVGYYLVVDSTTATIGEGDAYSRYMLQVVGPTSLTTKEVVPTIKKTVKTSTDTTYADYNTAAVGDTVDFKLAITTPSVFVDYDTYKMVITDELSNGLSLNTTTIKIAIGDNQSVEVSAYDADANPAQNIYYEVSGQTLTITIVDLLSETTYTAGNALTITYSATLTSDATMGNGGNENKATLEYSNDPYSTSTGETTPTTTKTYTTSLTVNKIDGTENKYVEGLNGAVFTLYDGNNKEVGIAEVSSSNQGVLLFDKLTEGTYTLKETTTPSGYNTASEITFTLSYVEGTGWTVTTSNLDNGTTAGTFKTTIQNKSGATIPSTGGMGTTILYIIGAILVIGAAVILVTRRRMANK